MDVTQSNFESILPEVIKDINEASFISFDGEFTGLSNGPTTHPFELPCDYYKKLWNGALDFLFVQCGIAIFKFDEKAGKYKCKIYNFYVFPRQSTRSTPDVRFLCQSSSLDFLIQHNFDFNKLIKEGIPYLTGSDEEALRKSMEEKKKWLEASANSTPIPVPNEIKSTVNNIMKQIEDFLNSDETETCIENCNAFVRKFIYQTFRERYKDDSLSIQTIKGGTLQVQKGSTKERKEAEQEKEVQNAIGFSKVIRAISESRKLIVGHLPVLDICHILHRFMDSLPASYDEFKDMAHCIFPSIIDTRYMAMNGCLNDLIPSKALSSMFQSIKENPFGGPEVEVAPGYGYSDLKPHEAGYDAYMTGCCFVAFMDYLESSKSKNSIFKNPLESSVVKKHLNKLSLIRINDSHIDLEKDDPVPSRENIFYMKFPSRMTMPDIKNCLKKFEFFYVHWETSETAFIEFKEPKEVAALKRDLAKKKKICSEPGVTLIPFNKAITQSSLSTPKNGSHASPRPNKKRSLEKEPTQELIKKPRTSSISSSKSFDTIVEEEEDPASCISQLETEAEASKTSGTFPTNEDWS